MEVIRQRGSRGLVAKRRARTVEYPNLASRRGLLPCRGVRGRNGGLLLPNTTRRTLAASHLPANPRRKRLPLWIIPALPPPHAVVGIRTATVRMQGLQQEATPLGIARHDQSLEPLESLSASTSVNMPPLALRGANPAEPPA